MPPLSKRATDNQRLHSRSGHTHIAYRWDALDVFRSTRRAGCRAWQNSATQVRARCRTMLPPVSPSGLNAKAYSAQGDAKTWCSGSRNACILDRSHSNYNIASASPEPSPGHVSDAGYPGSRATAFRRKWPRAFNGLSIAPTPAHRLAAQAASYGPHMTTILLEGHDAHRGSQQLQRCRPACAACAEIEPKRGRLIAVRACRNVRQRCKCSGQRRVTQTHDAEVCVASAALECGGREANACRSENPSTLILHTLQAVLLGMKRPRRQPEENACRLLAYVSPCGERAAVVRRQA